MEHTEIKIIKTAKDRPCILLNGSSRGHTSKKKRARSSSSSGSSSGGGEELQLLQRLEAERRRLKEERRRQKEAIKANETPEEKRARRLREKQAKERRRRERMGWDTEYQGYTDQDNPFGDSALTDTFVWGKKMAAEGVRGVARSELEALSRDKQRENARELEKVKRRRLEREAERAAREAEAAEAARAREAMQFSSWSRQEDAFHLQQARLRSQIRIRDGRAKPVDLLAWYVAAERRDDALEMHEPYAYLNGLGAADLEDLLADIEVYRELDTRDGTYWRDVRTIVRDELNKLRRLSAPDAAQPAQRRAGVHRAVAEDVTRVFRGKSAQQLDELQRHIEEKLRAPAHQPVDVGYWESLLSQLKAHMARARLRDRHQQNLRRKLQLLKQEQGVREERGDAPPDDAPAAAPASPPTTPPPADEPEDPVADPYPAGRYSPPPLSPRALEPGTLVTEPAEDEQRLAYLRARLLQRHDPGTAAGAGTSAAGGSSTADGLERLAVRSMGGASAEEVSFSVEHALPDQPCLWADKYRPRKPRYFNRVHTGFEWNKYNQTHYDMDNPPPKVVQGYKFNIFYPDLIDKGSTPQFSLKPCPENAEFAVLRFYAGPPYEDIAFKIVNREWEYSYKRGFRCHFHNNIFQLWFHFKRYRYRR